MFSFGKSTTPRSHLEVVYHLVNRLFSLKLSSQMTSCNERMGVMTCIPQSGGCERPFTEAFVEHLNQTGGCRYVHRACSDVASRQVPQPEALYEDSGRNMQLVIERKSISWSIDYPYRHKKSTLLPSSSPKNCHGFLLTICMRFAFRCC